MNATEARARIKDLGEFVGIGAIGSDTQTIRLCFVSYDPGARSGKFHSYKYLTLSAAVYEEIKHELK